MRIVACLNGDRRPGAHPALPATGDQLAADARAVVAAGATAVHIHPRDSRAEQALEPQILTPVLERLRAAIPDTPISVTTALSAEPDPWRRYDLIGRWGAMPDSVTVNLSEPGSIEVVRLLNDRRVDVEAGLASANCARILAASGLEFSRVLIEPPEAAVGEARTTAARIEGVLDKAGVELPRELHGVDEAAWTLLDDAIEAGYDLRIGLENTLIGPDGSEVHDNAELVRIAVARVEAAQAHPPARQS